MDWYFRSNGEDLVVPNDQETSDVQHADDRSPYPNGWLQWEVGGTENFLPPNKFLSRSMKPIGTGLNCNWQGFYEDFDLESSIHDGEVSSNQSAYGDFSLVDSCARTLEDSFHDEKMDDFWESAFIEDPLTINDLSNSRDSAYRCMSFGNLSTDMPMDPNDSLKDPSFAGSACCLKTSFSPLTDDIAEDEDQLEDVSPSSVTDNSIGPEGSPKWIIRRSDAHGSGNFQASVLSLLVPAEDTTSEIVGHVQEKKYLEATVLQELEDVTSQLNVETRICFRDALYRLAKISKQHRSIIKDKPSSEVDGESSCHGRPKSAESTTNAIDRTVANLMFNNSNSGPPGLPYPGRVHQYVESCQNPGSYNNILNQPVIHPHHHHPDSLPRGIKVPSCEKENRNSSHSSCILSYLMPAGGMDYISELSDHQAEDSVAVVDQFGRTEDSVAIIDQFGANQQLKFLHPKFTFAVALPHHQDG